LRPRGWHEPWRILSLDWTADGHDHRGLVCKSHPKKSARTDLTSEFPLPYACDPLGRIVHPGQVLDVRGRHDIDVGAEQLIDVLPALSRRLPGTLRWASSSTNATAGRRARTAPTSRSPKEVPR
jgi:hypothetical protein